jgi:hypothetical protein
VAWASGAFDVFFISLALCLLLWIFVTGSEGEVKKGMQGKVWVVVGSRGGIYMAPSAQSRDRDILTKLAELSKLSKVSETMEEKF